LAGHTQVTFVTVIGAGLYALWLSWPALRDRARSVTTESLWTLPVTHLVLAGILGLVLAAAQVLPTVELSRSSIRGSGLSVKEAVSFSLHPLLVGRSLLPGYGETLFSEYVASLPLTVVLLALVALWRRWQRVGGLVVIAGIGLFFALGAANPIYVLLVKFVPGFDLFRAPARWLALYVFAMAGLAAIGLDGLLRNPAHPRRQPLLAWLTVILSLVGWSYLAPQLTGSFPSPPESPIRAPATDTLLGWAVEALAVVLILLARRWCRLPIRIALLAGTAVTVLFISSRPLPANHPTAPEALDALRPAPAHLLAAARNADSQPPGRFLSISDTAFDPGDVAELESIYSDRLDADAFYDFLIATKQKEILAPNLPLLFGLSAVDGYDGGVLPLANFVSLQRLLLAKDQVSMDGRLRENLTAIPDGRWLSLFDARFVITDKVGDAWADGVFYDLQHVAELNGSQPNASVAYLPSFEATGLGVVLSYPDVEAGTPLVRLVIRFADGREHEMLLRAAEGETLRPSADGRTLVVRRFSWPQPGIPVALVAIAVGEPSLTITVRGVSLVDSRDGTFQSLVLSGTGRYRLVHSGDVKIYENLDRPTRAFLVPQATWAPSDEAALSEMRVPGFDPAAQVVLSGGGEPLFPTAYRSPGHVAVRTYEPERVVLHIEATDPAWLVLTDAFYPGWRATIDGRPTSIVRANLLFRALPIDPGTHQVVFSFRPPTVRAGIAISLSAAVIWILAWFMMRRHTRRR
jgi:hypothetical protein